MELDINTAQRPGILVVDDHQATRNMLKVLLETEGYHAALAKDGHDAIEKLCGPKMDLILLNIPILGMDGFVFTSYLETTGMRDTVPIIAMSADDRGEEHAALMRADDYLPKPFNIDVLLNKLALFTIGKGCRPASSPARFVQPATYNDSDHQPKLERTWKGVYRSQMMKSS